MYKNLPKFKDVKFKQFQNCLRDHSVAFKKKYEDSIGEEEAFKHDCLLHPHNETHDHQRKQIFDLSIWHGQPVETGHSQMSVIFNFWYRNLWYA